MGLETEFKTKPLCSVTPLHWPGAGGEPTFLLSGKLPRTFHSKHWLSSASPVTHLSQKANFDKISSWHGASTRSLPGFQSQKRAARESYQQVRLEAPASREETDSNAPELAVIFGINHHPGQFCPIPNYKLTPLLDSCLQVRKAEPLTSLCPWRLICS